MKYKQDQINEKSVGVRELTRNFTYHLENLDEKPLNITKHAEVIAILSLPKERSKRVTTKVSQSPFFTQFSEPKEWLSKTSEQVSSELRSKAWKRT